MGTRGVPALYGGFETAVEEIGKRLVDPRVRRDRVLPQPRADDHLVRGHDARQRPGPATPHGRDPLPHHGQHRARDRPGPSRRRPPAQRRQRAAAEAAGAGRHPDRHPPRRAGVQAREVAGHGRRVLPLGRARLGEVGRRGDRRRAGDRRPRAARSTVGPASSSPTAPRSSIRAATGSASWTWRRGATTSSSRASSRRTTCSTPCMPIARAGETRPLVVVGSAPYSQWYVDKVREAARSDPRIRFTGGIYDQGLLDQLYANGVTYIHGHSVGGTNPSLLRAMGAGAPVLAYDVEFNREVTAGNAFFWADAAALTPLLDQIAEGELDDRLRRAARPRAAARSRRLPVGLGDRRLRGAHRPARGATETAMTPRRGRPRHSQRRALDRGDPREHRGPVAAAGRDRRGRRRVHGCDPRDRGPGAG